MTTTQVRNRSYPTIHAARAVNPQTVCIARLNAARHAHTVIPWGTVTTAITWGTLLMILLEKTDDTERQT